MIKQTVWEYIRVKFKPGTDPKGKRTNYSRPKRIYKVTITEEDEDTKEVVVKIEYAPPGVIGTIRRINSGDFITEWEGGKTPTPKPLRKYSNDQLRELGYTFEEIYKIRGRRYSSKQIKLVCNKFKDPITKKRISREEAKQKLDEFNGNSHLLYESAGLIKSKKS